MSKQWWVILGMSGLLTGCGTTTAASLPHYPLKDFSSLTQQTFTTLHIKHPTGPRYLPRTVTLAATTLYHNGYNIRWYDNATHTLSTTPRVNNPGLKHTAQANLIGGYTVRHYATVTDAVNAWQAQWALASPTTPIHLPGAPTFVMTSQLNAITWSRASWDFVAWDATFATPSASKAAALSLYHATASKGALPPATHGFATYILTPTANNTTLVWTQDTQLISCTISLPLRTSIKIAQSIAQH